MQLPLGYRRIDSARNHELNTQPFNEAYDGYRQDGSDFSDRFTREIREFKSMISDFCATFGVYGSLDRFLDKLPSDWWINDDHYSSARVLMIDILNPALTRYEVIEGAREVLRTFPHEWMLCFGHNNAYNDCGQHVGNPGEYWFWIKADRVEFYSELDSDLEVFFKSLPPLDNKTIDQSPQ